ncbi:MAG: SDR family oxidoreductase [Methylophilaceae bacterium]|nr:MAG: SDR family oxidoreductase [Methylophilaceae bacterium]
MDAALSGKVVLVTGASRGIGAEIARKLSSQGALLALCSRHMDGLDLLASQNGFNEDNSILIAEDLSEETGVTSCTRLVLERFGRIDALVNNVGGATGRGAFLDVPDNEWIKTFETNVLSLVRLAKILKPHLSHSGQGRIVTISSTTAQEPGQFDPHYSSAKAAVTNLSKHLANIFASDGITVNVISPGPILTDGLIEFMSDINLKNIASGDKESEKFLSGMKSRIPLGDLGSTADIASLVSFLLSNDAGWITGSNFRIDGGKNRSIF